MYEEIIPLSLQLATNWAKIVDAGFSLWFAGFVDGEGSFMLLRKRRIKRRISTGANEQYYTYEAVFSVGQKADPEIMQRIQSQLGVGYIYPQGDMTVLATSKITELCILVKIFDRFPLQTKKKQYEFQLWSRAVLALARARDKHFYSPGRVKANEICGEVYPKLRRRGDMNI